MGDKLRNGVGVGFSFRASSWDKGIICFVFGTGTWRRMLGKGGPWRVIRVVGVVGRGCVGPNILGGRMDGWCRLLWGSWMGALFYCCLLFLSLCSFFLRSSVPDSALARSVYRSSQFLSTSTILVRLIIPNQWISRDGKDGLGILDHSVMCKWGIQKREGISL